MRRLYKRFSKLVPYGELPSWFKRTGFDKTTLADDSVGTKTFEFYQKLRSMLTIIRRKYTICIYPLRVAELYVCSCNGKPKLFDSNQKLYKHLIKLGLSDSDELRKEFKIYKMLDFEKLASIIPNATATYEKLYQYQVEETDIMVKEFRSRKENKLRVWAIPCLFEDYVYFEVFVHRDVVDDKFKARIKKEKLIEMKDEAFFTPAEVFSEFAENLSKEINF